MEPVLREATLEDVPALTELMRVTFSETFRHYPQEELAAHLEEAYSEERTRSSLTVPSQRTWVLEEPGGALVGYAVAGEADLPHPQVTERAGQLHRLYLRPSAQGAGLGRKLMDTALAFLSEQQRTPLFISVWEHNERALAFYRRYGFEPVGEYPYPVGRTVDRELILRRVEARG